MRAMTPSFSRVLEPLGPAWQRVRDLRWGLRAGLLLGGVSVFLALAGLIEFFARMDILDLMVGDVLVFRLPLSTAFLILPAFLAAYMASGPGEHGERPRGAALRLLNGALAGLMVAAFLAGLSALIDGITSRETAVWSMHVTGFRAFWSTASEWPPLAERIGGAVPPLVRQIGLREILVSATPELVALLTLGQPVAVGAAFLLLGGLVLGLVGTVVRSLAPLHRRAVYLAGGLVLLGAVLREFVRPLLPNFGLDSAQQRILYVGQGLSLWGMLLLIALALGVVYLLPLVRRALANPAGMALWYGQLAVLLVALILLAVAGSAYLPDAAMLVIVWASRVLALLFAAAFLALVVLALWQRFTLPAGRQSARAPARASQTANLIMAFAVLAVLPFLLREQSEILNKFGLAVLMGLGLNIVVGFAGLLDLGYVAFYAIGAYTVGVLTSLAPYLQRPVIGWSFWEALPVAVVAAALAGIILGIPVLRMRGDYLAIVTLAFGEIIRVLVKSDLLKPYIGGAQGILNIPPPAILGLQLNTPQTLYFLIFVCVLLALFVSTRLAPSRIGRAWMAMRDDEDVAEAVGVPLVSYKLLAFATGAAFSGMAGAIFAAKVGSDFPSSFDLLISINVLCVIIVGGMGSNPGVLVGALVLFVVPELLQVVPEFRYMIFGALLVVMMLVRPEGLWPARRMRQLRAEEEEAT